jgi:shikimate kinase/3-dehydroquinate synthase
VAALAAQAPARALIFIGFMGSGKSTAAREVAAALGTHALDSDKLLEERMGHSIADAFAAEGEAGFREREQALVLELLGAAGPGSVLSLGGGSVGSELVREALRAHLVVFLDVDVQTAWERVRGAGAQRPLARDRDEFGALHRARKPIYEGVANATLPATGNGVAVRALGALAALGRAPAGTQALWASAASGEYPVLVGKGLLGDGATAEAVWPLNRTHSRAFCVSDETVAGIYGGRLGAVTSAITIAAGEVHKTLASAETVWRGLADAGMTRSDHIVALGGGVVGDLAGFCAATYQRGVGVVHVPTTLVAQVDSAYGGKTGVDLPQAKNYVGAYHQPAGVLVDPDLLQTLPEPERNAGWVEVLKTALIAGGELWRRLAADEPVGEEIILACAQTKLGIVAGDERDSGRRQVLNLGHTIGHAIETATGYSRYRHGEAVGLGLLVALELSGAAQLREQVQSLLAAHRLPLTVQGASAQEIIAATVYDKKRMGGAMPPFVLVNAPGEVSFGVEVDEADVRRALATVASR